MKNVQPEGQVWFASDYHFGHNNIIDFYNRPYVDEFQQVGEFKVKIKHTRVELMDQDLIARWNDTVADNDTVYFLGDLAMGRVETGLANAKRLRGNKILVPGNHDRNWFGGKASHENWNSAYRGAGFSILANSVDDGNGIISLSHLFEDLGLEVDASHFPFDDPTDPRVGDRFAAYKPENHGQWLIHGHVHDKWVLREKMINIGCDVWDLKPVSIDVIKKIMVENPNGGPSEVV